ncbi:SpoIVB peptidase S55 domain-containing protein [Phytoactinopolyspora limicola]|uniref:SpoIVB peptidase S55 domain-containing protein n=1 Tax=Phytoactinopolyspora limicola TaxID=2715536 RepID=UPI00140B306F|nr:SpoIVB peptidase S55 domain-containing protein [Phytoactinopolyspora limicola]
MSTTSPIARRRRTLPAAAVVVALLATGTAVAIADPTPDPCPDPYPVGDVTDGLTATGLTVERGSDPEPFTATVVGVINDGIGPGIDMIIADTESAAIERAGGIWSGMSGSPVYADDGRLIGAVAYGFSLAPSPIAGLVPAEDMHRLLDHPSEVPTLTSGDASALPAELADHLTRSGKIDAAQARDGLRRLTLPVAVSGVGADRFDALTERLADRAQEIRAYPAGSVDTDQPGDTGDIQPGGNFAAAVSHGDVTLAAVGTTTSVCGNDVLAFGHPFLWAGSSALTAHPAEAVFVQRDNTFGSFKIANLGGAVGTLDQDRLAGVRARLGSVPTTIPVTADVTAPEGSYHGITHAVLADMLDEITVYHTWSAFDSALDRVGPGAADIRWSIEGLRADGQPFQLAAANVYSSPADVAAEAPFGVADHLMAIVHNEFEDVEVTAVELDAEVTGQYSYYRFAAVEVRQPDGSYQPPSTSMPLPVAAGSEIGIRVTLTPYKNLGDTATIELALDVPGDAAGSFGWVDVSGGPGDDDGEYVAAMTPNSTSFDELLNELENITPNNAVAAILSLDEADDVVPPAATHETVEHVVRGHHSFPVEVTE